MAVVYVDTSALGRVLLGEPDAPAILRDLGAFDQRVASRLLCANGTDPVSYRRDHSPVSEEDQGVEQ